MNNNSPVCFRSVCTEALLSKRKLSDPESKPESNSQQQQGCPLNCAKPGITPVKGAKSLLIHVKKNLKDEVTFPGKNNLIVYESFTQSIHDSMIFFFSLFFIILFVLQAQSKY